jgi:hypothetical protein
MLHDFPTDKRNKYDISTVNIALSYCQKPQIFLLQLPTFDSYYMPFGAVKSMYNTTKKKGRTSPLSSICPKTRHLLRSSAAMRYPVTGFLRLYSFVKIASAQP